MAKVNAKEYAEKWARRLKGSTEDIRRGVQKVTVAPGKMAAQAKELLKQKLIEAIDNGLWETRVAGVSLEEWQEAILNKGVNRIGAGVDGAMVKQEAMAEKLLADVDAVAREVHTMPKGTLEDSIARMTHFARGMNKRKQTGRR